MSKKHFKYPSLDNFKIKFLNKYAGILQNHDIIVSEKIHGSNICIVGYYNKGWTFKLGTRNRWLNENEKFHNFNILFQKNKNNIENLFNELKPKDQEEITIRMFGEIYGGKYGKTKDLDSFKVQKEPNYCPFNDFLFFDIFINTNSINIIKTNELLTKHKLKISPIIYQGNFLSFIQNFELEKFNSLVSKQYYNLPFINTPKSTEGVIIRPINNTNELYSELEIILKYKKEWALESGGKKIIINQDSELENRCYNMLNENRLNSLKSKNTTEDLFDIKLIGKHINDIKQDILLDIKKTFTIEEYSSLNLKKIQKNLSRLISRDFKLYLKNLEENTPKNINEKIKFLEVSNSNLNFDINKIQNRLKIINRKLNKFF